MNDIFAGIFPAVLFAKPDTFNISKLQTRKLNEVLSNSGAFDSTS